jgi:uncharacterized protein (DUF433 family)
LEVPAPYIDRLNPIATIQVIPTFIGTALMTRQEIEHQLLTLSLSDKAEIVQSLTKTLNMSGKGITKTPGVCGGEACIAGTRIAIWLLVEAQQLGISEAQLLQDYPHITAADLVNAWVYANAYADEISALILANNEAA